MLVLATNVNKSVPERRAATRLVAHCDAEVIASLTILDNDAVETDEQIMFSGRTSDLSLEGLGIVLPSAPIDERFCANTHEITVRLHLPYGPVQLRLVPSRCVSVLSVTLTPGYLLAGKIISNEKKYTDYVNRLTPHAE